ncbi:hypothetical protein RJT34_29983 [Clitoria ternatea]|uniref:glucan endo-1,3-beta-D-glucosidase n=1 Tax=Clitoria ternatea TaxID=43366 RepID=A0AAN9EW67_CLITE
MMRGNGFENGPSTKIDFMHRRLCSRFEEGIYVMVQNHSGGWMVKGGKAFGWSWFLTLQIEGECVSKHVRSLCTNGPDGIWASNGCELKDFFTAGTYTTATSVEWALAELMMNPLLLRQAREEIEKVLGSDGNILKGDNIVIDGDESPGLTLPRARDWSGLEVTAAQTIGVCYGQVSDNLPPAQEVVDLYKANGIGRMRIYNPDQATIQALSGSNIELVVGVPNENIQSLASAEEAATEWLLDNVLSYSKDVKFRYIVVGNEISPDDEIAQFVLPAMQNIYAALASSNLPQIKVSTAISIALLGPSYPPSIGAFSSSSSPYIKPIIKFLKKNGAPLLANLYTYFSYIDDPKNIELSYALFTSPKVVEKDGSYEYKNLFDATLGALYSALEKIGAPDLEVVISESGWPSHGGNAATVDNAQTYYSNLVNHVSGGTPKRPNQPIETYLFAMFDEDQKGPAETERHFGLFSPNKQPKYQIQFTQGSSQSPPSDQGSSQCPPSDQGSSQSPPSDQSSSQSLTSEGILFSLFLPLSFFYFW